MFRLMTLEYKRTNFKDYYIADIAILFAAFAFIYLFANLPRLEPLDPDMNMFLTYMNITSLLCMLFMVIFSILSSVMFSKVVIEEYSKHAMLLFSYPIKRFKIMSAKILVVSLFTIISMLIILVLSFGVFYFTESLYPLVKDVLTPEIIQQTCKVSVLYSLCAISIGIISMRVGLGKKSVSVTIVTSIIISSVICNIIGIAMNTDIILIVISLLISIIAIVIVIDTNKYVDNMEV